MRLSRLARRFVATFSVVALLLGQALMAAHACVLEVAAETSAPDCHHAPLDPADHAVCKAHCDAGQQSVGEPRPPAAPDLLTPVLVVAAPALDDRLGATAVRRDHRLVRGGAPPPLVLTGRLRI